MKYAISNQLCFIYVCVYIMAIKKRTERKSKILLLCHGNKHTFEYCPIPISRKMMEFIVTVDIDPECCPDYLEDFTKPTQLKKESIDFACAIYYPQNLIVSKSGNLIKNHFIRNIIKVLKPGGYYVLTKLPQIGFKNFCKYLRTKKGQDFLIQIHKFRTVNIILEKQYDELTHCDTITINKIFGKFVQQCYPDLKLLQTKSELHKYKSNFIQKMVEPRDTLTDLEKKYGFNVFPQIFMKI